jgi:hypothetical protein
MSIEIVLVPLALAALSGWRASAEATDVGTCVVQTRLRDPGLLAEALRTLGAQVSGSDGVVTGRLGGVELSFSARDDGTVLAHVAGADAEQAERLVLAVDEAYAAAVQAALHARLLARAPGLGLRLVEQSVGEDDAITLVLETDRS